jgi:radical SAM superfamily enzyme YgiQ (UPF0313 family)
MKVLVANPPAYFRPNLTRHFIQAGSRWSFSIKIPKNRGIKEHYQPYPFFLAYTTALLKQTTDAKVKGLDACALDFDDVEFTDWVMKYKPDLLIVEVPTVSFPLTMKALKHIKSRLPDIKIAVAGGHITALTEDVMKEYTFIDYALLGEYELTAKKLVEALMKGENTDDLKNINGLAFRKDDQIIFNNKRMLLLNLDELPYPDREDFNIDLYHDFEIAGTPTIQMLSSRGCPYSCIFCLERHVIYASPIYRIRDPIRVVDEMEYVKYKYKAKQVYFDDMNTTLNKKHVAAIAHEIIKRKLDISWACMADINIDRETLKLMAKSGCVGIKFGVESINVNSLKAVNKLFVSQHRVEKFNMLAKELGFFTHATYTIGLPEDTRESILATIKFSMKLDTDSAQFSILTPLPGTPLFNIAKERGWLVTYDWTMYDGANYAVISYPHLSNKEIEALYHLAVNLWWIKKRGLMKGLLDYLLNYPTNPFKLIKRFGFRDSIRLVGEFFDVIY